ncbi:phage baseplate protein [Thermus phage MN1]|nr:phage baseplate protein [Thermus phage MN1]
MALYETLKSLDTEGLEVEAARIILEKIAQDLPSLTDYSPGSPHVVIAEAVAWAQALGLYHIARLPEILEEYIVRVLYGGQEAPATPSRTTLVLTFSTPAPSSGRSIAANTAFVGPGGLVFITTAPYNYPAGTYGNETSGGEYVYQVPVVCTTAGAHTNVPANTITRPQTAIPGLVAVTNPHPATGGKDAETYEEMRDRLLRNPPDSKLITQGDYEEFIRYYYGGGRVYVIGPTFPDFATSDPNWQAGYVSLAVILPDGTPLSDDLVLKTVLLSVSPMGIPRFVAPTITTVDVSGTVYYSLSADLTKVQEGVNAALQSLISPLTWEGWGRWPNDLYPSQVEAAIHGVDGVVGVSLSSPNAKISLPTPYSAPILGTVSLAYEGV